MTVRGRNNEYEKRAKNGRKKTTKNGNNNSH
jgi:hypothetical protein